MSARGGVVGAVATPLGPVAVTEVDGAITRLAWPADGPAPATPLLRAAAEQLSAYFAGALRAFELPLRPGGCELHQRVFAAMGAIPIGETRSYGQVAAALGVPAQAVGQACGANPIPIIVPCHRVLAADGLGGYSGPGGVESKIWLLRHEGGYPFLL